ncbi:hypothetical protein ISG33_10615 [Glaciecola sp. MH2013]|uniref:hypothetical protein n=1 Tax=Glaciecola sp. MH2013 TaxID=2785524 RepID=UPI0018A03240|nr:hypothetical protein [Glaciecola sp. MH2013]MBF7073851.1 hypothetical protein [Glaciecola sp. MH2013]
MADSLLQKIAVTYNKQSRKDAALCALFLFRNVSPLKVSISLMQTLGDDKATNNGASFIESDVLLLLKACADLATLSINIEKELIEKCDASYHLGDFVYSGQSQAEADTGSTIKTRFNSRAKLGIPIAGVTFHHILAKLKLDKGASTNFDHSLLSYSLNGLLCDKQRFTHPTANERDIRSSICYAMTCDTALFTQWLFNYIERLNQALALDTTSSTPTISVIEDSRSENIANLNSSTNTAKQNGFDFVFSFDSQARNNECASASVSATHLSYISATCKIERDSCGNEQLINMSRLQGVYQIDGYSYLLRSSASCCYIKTIYDASADAEITQQSDISLHRANILTLLESLNFPMPANALHVDIKHVEQPRKINENFSMWAGKEWSFPAELAQETKVSAQRTPLLTLLELWLSLFPHKTEARPNSQNSDVNKHISRSFNRLSNMQLAHYQSFQNMFSASARSEAENKRLALFINTGAYYLAEQDTIPQHAWTNLFIALDLWPKRYDPMVNNIPNLHILITKLLAQIAAAADKQPSIDNYIEQHLMLQQDQI